MSAHGSPIATSSTISKLDWRERPVLRYARVWLLLGVLGTECYSISLRAHPAQSLFTLASISSFLVPFSVALVIFGLRRAKPALAVLPAPDLRWAVLHGLILCFLAWLLLVPLRNDLSGTAYPAAGLLGWYSTIAALFVSLVFTLFPETSAYRLARSLGVAWLYAALVALAVLLAKPLLQWTWNVPGLWLGRMLQIATFASVKGVLDVFYTKTVSEPAQLTLGTSRFTVTIGGQCSGVEGLTLMLVFAGAWLIFARRELRLSRALLLLPASLAAVWLMNIVRIAALVAIGDAGHEDVAVQGFHSVTGWILFNAVALSFLLATQHIRWLRSDSTEAAKPAAVSYIAAPYLMPFLGVLAASMIGHAATSGFDWPYPLRLAVAVAILYWYRADYRKMTWRFGWVGPVAGAAVFAMWFLLARWHHASGALLQGELARLPAWQRVSWIAIRAFASVITVPIVEELAFRGYLARRIQSSDIETVSFAKLSLPAIFLSSLIFGAMHGSMWIAGTVAGLVFALVAKLRGSLGEAVAAHATANLLIAVFVLSSGDYRMWA